MRKLLLVFSFVFISVAIQAQGNLIKGQLFDASVNNEPVTFGNVTIKETKQSVSTDFRGNYFFENLDTGTYTLQFSFLGYNTYIKQIVVRSKSSTIVFDAFIEPSQAISFDDVLLTTSN